jgi:hypothetical protein
VALESTQRTSVPAWAVLERRLIDAVDTAAPIYASKYTRPGGELIWRRDYPGDGVWADDLYESFFNWPLFYALGGSREVLDLAIQEWSAITRQIMYDYGRATNEFIDNDDWFHNSENYILFYFFGLADPTNGEMVKRARRFAGLYMGEDPQAPNYDPEHRLIRSPFSGAKGPLFHARFGDVHYNLEYRHVTLGPGYALQPKWYEDAALRAEVHAKFDEVVMRGDIPVNLGVVGLVTNAYLYTGEAKYRDWVVGYVEAWMERIKRNGGIIPDNVGLTGRIGEYRDGQWWGGHYGWSGLYSLHMIGSALIVAAQCAQLITGDARYLNLLRSQIDMLLARAKEEQGKLLVPTKHTDEGWVDYRPLTGLELAHLWTASQAGEDWDRLERVRLGSGRNWNTVRDVRTKGEDGHEEPWLRFLTGANPRYPEEILSVAYRQVCNRMDLVLNDASDLTKVSEHHWQERNPVLVEALVQLTTGAPMTIYNGALLQGRVRYFDPSCGRAGLPRDVAALVTRLGAEGLALQLVNLSVHESRDVVIQAGCYGEHEFTEATCTLPGDGGEQTAHTPIHSKAMTVRLRPGTEVQLELGMRRYANKPSYAFPWHGDSIPVR